MTTPPPSVPEPFRRTQTFVGASLVAVGIVGCWLLVYGRLRNPLLADVVPVLIGGGVTLLAGLRAHRVVKTGDVQVPAPYADVDPGVPLPAASLGLLERIFFFSTIWGGQPAGVAAWFALKVAAKWNAWSHIVRVPESLPEGVEGLKFRLAWSTRILSRFLIGTLYNLLCGALGAAVALVVARFLVTGGPAL